MTFPELAEALDFYPAPLAAYRSANGLYLLSETPIAERPFLTLCKAADRQGFAIFPFSKPVHVTAIIIFLRELDYAPAHRLHRFNMLNALLFA